MRTTTSRPSSLAVIVLPSGARNASSVLKVSPAGRLPATGNRQSTWPGDGATAGSLAAGEADVAAGRDADGVALPVHPTSTSAVTSAAQARLCDRSACGEKGERSEGDHGERKACSSLGRLFAVVPPPEGCPGIGRGSEPGV